MNVPMMDGWVVNNVVSGWMDRWVADGWTDRWLGGWMDGQM